MPNIFKKISQQDGTSKLKETNPTVFQMKKRTTLKEGGKNSKNVQRVFDHTPSISDGVPRCAKILNSFHFQHLFSVVKQVKQF